MSQDLNERKYLLFTSIERIVMGIQDDSFDVNLIATKEGLIKISQIITWIVIEMLEFTHFVYLT
jgi:hypothetical protein